MGNDHAGLSALSNLPDLDSLLEAVDTALSKYARESNTKVLFSRLLHDVVRLTESEFGLAGRVINVKDGCSYKNMQIVSSITRNPETCTTYQNDKMECEEVSGLKPLYRRALATGGPVISNYPGEDGLSTLERNALLPLKNFLLLPLEVGGIFIGMFCLARRNRSYHESITDYLAPFLATCASIIFAHDKERQLEQIEHKLECYQMETDRNAYVEIGPDYSFCPHSKILCYKGENVLLTKKESCLLTILVENLNTVVSNTHLEQEIWKNGITGESSLRSLVMRLRKKATGLAINTISGVGYLLGEVA